MKKVKAVWACLILLLCLAGNGITGSAATGIGRYLEFSSAGLKKIYKAGDSFTLRVKGKGSKDEKLKWSSSNKKVAVVSQDGVVSVRRAGSCRITAANQEKLKATFEFQAVNYEIPNETPEDVLTVSVQSASGKTYDYTVYRQEQKAFGKYRKFLKYHGCATSALTTLLGSRIPELAGYTPEQVIEKVEKKIFPKSVVKRNYSRSVPCQRSVNMNGMCVIMKKYHIAHKYVTRFTKDRAVKEIEAHLLKGKPVIITVGKGKWACSYHTMLMIGMTPSGKAIIADSANREWAGEHQRIKYGKVSELVKDTWSGGRTSNVYWSGYNGCGGYILVG